MYLYSHKNLYFKHTGNSPLEILKYSILALSLTLWKSAGSCVWSIKISSYLYWIFLSFLLLGQPLSSYIFLVFVLGWYCVVMPLLMIVLMIIIVLMLITTVLMLMIVLMIIIVLIPMIKLVLVTQLFQMLLVMPN